MMNTLLGYTDNIPEYTENPISFIPRDDDQFTLTYPLVGSDEYIYLFDLKALENDPSKLGNKLQNLLLTISTDKESKDRLFQIKEIGGWNYYGFRVGNWESLMMKDNRISSLIKAMVKLTSEYEVPQSPPTPVMSVEDEGPYDAAEIPLDEEEISEVLSVSAMNGRAAGAAMVKAYPELQRAIIALPDSILQAIREELTLAGSVRGIADRTAPDFTDRANLLKEISRTDPMLAETIKGRALGDVISGRVSVDQYQDITGLLQPTMQGNIAIDPRKQAVKGKISYADIPRWI